ncbi:MAG: twin-arginine translocation signal domain-containing protein [Chloroflexi bacterium]|jgi:menaquinone-dependent protoporphyrinogen oxidase|nr:flavodoxin domain-containing protein [Anaerolineaceae bacterium]NMB87882.1 twin-arginine translocation signal domain-containing protein [Chloroflexota bacterium]
MSEQISRRNFLKTGCLAAAAVGVTLCGGTALVGTRQPAVDQPNTTYGNGNDGPRLLVAYATRAGSTAEVAARIGDTLAGGGRRVDVRPAGTVDDVRPYQAVVVGSAIRMGSLLPEAMRFIEKHQADLLQRSFSAFVVCLDMATPDETTLQTVSAYLDPVRALVPPAHAGLFAGVMNPDKLSLLDRMIAVNMIQSPVGDFRRWDQIDAWAAGLGVAG